MNIFTKQRIRKSRHGFVLFTLLASSATNWVVAADTTNENQTVGSTKSVDQSITEYLTSNPEIAVFVNALKNTELWSLLESADQATIIMPTNKAMQIEGSIFLLESVLLAAENKERLNRVLSTHIILGKDQIKDTIPLSLVTRAGSCLHIEPKGGALKIGSEAYVTDRFQANNGTIYLIDRLLWQEDQQSSECGNNLIIADEKKTG